MLLFVAYLVGLFLLFFCFALLIFRVSNHWKVRLLCLTASLCIALTWPIVATLIVAMVGVCAVILVALVIDITVHTPPTQSSTPSEY